MKKQTKIVLMVAAAAAAVVLVLTLRRRAAHAAPFAAGNEPIASAPGGAKGAGLIASLYGSGTEALCNSKTGGGSKAACAVAGKLQGKFTTVVVAAHKTAAKKVGGAAKSAFGKFF